MKTEEFFQQVIVGLIVALTVLLVDRHLRADDSHGGCKCGGSCGGGAAKKSGGGLFCGGK